MRPIILACLATLLALPNATLRVSAQTQSQLEVTAIRRDRPVPLVEALTIVGLHLKGGFVSFGVDVYGETDPEVDVNMPDTNLGDALRRITSQTPGFTSEFVSGGEPRWALQVLAEPRTNDIMLVFFVCVELSCLTEISDSMEHSQRPFGIIVDFGNYKSQIHRFPLVLPHRTICVPCGIGKFIRGKK